MGRCMVSGIIAMKARRQKLVLNPAISINNRTQMRGDIHAIWNSAAPVNGWGNRPVHITIVLGLIVFCECSSTFPFIAVPEYPTIGLVGDEQRPYYGEEECDWEDDGGSIALDTAPASVGGLSVGAEEAHCEMAI